MNLIDRFIRFYIHESMWWLALLVGLVALLAWKYWSSPFLLPLYATMALVFMLPVTIHGRCVLKYALYSRRLLNAGIPVVVVMVVLTFVGSSVWGTVLFSHYVALMVGFLFWTVTSDRFDMVSWLAHPLEYGHPPDEIQLLDKRREDGVVNCLWRYRYGDEWDVGITGFETFAFEDGRCNALSPDESYALYRGWYDDEGIEDMRNEAIDEYLDS